MYETSFTRTLIIL